jgi:pimeloyl-ACP methyl ester carboxylesterase
MPASRRRPAGSTPELDIYVERFSRGSGPSVVYLTGGPGIGLDAYVSLGVVEKMLSSLDGEILLIEQRGNVRSPGKLSCSPGEETAGCLGRLAKEEAHPEDYNTVESADDVVEVLDAFGVARAVIWGHSYGSGLAQFAVKNHPERFLSVVLEGVSSPTTPRASDPVPSRLATLSAFGEWYSKRCETDPMCAAAYPSGIKPAAEVEQLMMNSGNDPNYTIQLVDGQQLLVGDLEAWFLNGLATYDGMLGFSQLVYAHNRATAQDRSSMDGWLTAVGHGDRAAGAKSVRGFADALASITSAASRDVKSCFDLQTFDADPDCAALPRDV